MKHLFISKFLFCIVLFCSLFTVNVFAGTENSENINCSTDNVFWPIWMTESAIQENAGSLVQSFCINNSDCNFYVWENTYEAQFLNHLSLTIGNVGWAGAGFSIQENSQSHITAQNLLDSIKTYPDNFHIRLSVRSTDNASHAFYLFDNALGFTLGSTEQYELPLYGDFNRDGQWHTIDIPMSRWASELKNFTWNNTNIFCILSEGIQNAHVDVDYVYFYTNVSPIEENLSDSIQKITVRLDPNSVDWSNAYAYVWTGSTDAYYAYEKYAFGYNPRIFRPKPFR